MIWATIKVPRTYWWGVGFAFILNAVAFAYDAVAFAYKDLPKEKANAGCHHSFGDDFHRSLDLRICPYNPVCDVVGRDRELALDVIAAAVIS